MSMETMDVTTFNSLYRNGGDAKKQPGNRKVTKADRASLEDAFMEAFEIVAPDLPLPWKQWRFHDTRRWRFDFAFREQKIAVEIQGGAFVFGAHGRGAQQAKDHEKINEAQRLGWTVLQYGTKAMSDPYRVAAEVAEVLRAKLKEQP